MDKSVIYVRVSTEEQALHGYSIEGQEKACREFAKQQGFIVDKVFIDDGYSAKDLNRPQIQELFKYCDLRAKNNIKAIVIWKQDRLSRDTTDYHGMIKPFLLKNKIKLLSTTETNEDSITGDLSRNMYMCFAEFERKQIGQRTNAGMRTKAEKGIYPSKAPVGYKNVENEYGEKIIAIDETKAFFIRRAFELYATNTYSIKKLRDKLAKEEFKCGKTPISKTGLQQILKSDFYIGHFTWQGTKYLNGKHKPIITPSLYYKVQDILNNKNGGGSRKHNFLFTKLIKHDCGRYLTAEIQKGNVYYVCAGQKNHDENCTGSGYIKEEVIEAEFEKLFESLQLPQEWVDKIQKEITLHYKDSTIDNQHSREALNKKKLQIENKIDKLYEDKLDGCINEDFFKKKFNDYNTEIDKIDIQIKDILKDTENRFKYANSLIELCRNAVSLYKGASIENKKILINMITSNITLKDEKLLVELKPVFSDMAKVANILKWYPDKTNIRHITDSIYNEITPLYDDVSYITFENLKRAI